MNKFSANKQSGVTLITSLILLLIMTIVGVSATKVSSLNLLIAGNDQQRMRISQLTQNQITQFVTTENLVTTFTAAGFQPSAGQTNSYIFDQVVDGEIKEDKAITDKNYKFVCKRNGLASSIGADAPKCDLYDYYLTLKSTRSSARSRRHQGAGKMVPDDTHTADATNGDYNFVN